MGYLDFFSSAFSTATTNRTNKQLAAEDRDFQQQMNERNNQFAHDEAELAFGRELEKMNLENEYNSPSAQMARYRAAGLNPSVMMSGQSAMAGSSPSSAPQASPSSSGVATHLPNQIPLTNIPSEMIKGISDLAHAKQAISESTKSNAEASRINKMLNLESRKMESEIRAQEMKNTLDTIFAGKRMSLDMQSLQADIYKRTNEALLLAQEGKESEARTATEKIKTLLTSKQLRLSELDVETYSTRMSAEINRLRAQANEANASAESSRASAEESRARTRTEDELRQLRHDLLSKDIKVQEYTGKKLFEEWAQAVKATDLLPKDVDVDELRENFLRSVRADLEHKEWQNTFWGHVLSSGVGSAVANGAVSGALFMLLPK